MEEAEASDILTNAWFVEKLAGSVQEYVPEVADTLDVIIPQLKPLSVEYSNLTLAMLAEVQVIALTEPENQDSPPIGLVSASEVIEKLALVSDTVGTEGILILTFAVVEGVFGIGVQL